MLSVLASNLVTGNNKSNSVNDLKNIMEGNFLRKRTSLHHIHEYKKASPELSKRFLEKRGSYPLSQLKLHPKHEFKYVYTSSTEFLANLDKSVEKDANFATYHRCSYAKPISPNTSNTELPIPLNDVVDLVEEDENYWTIICKIWLVFILSDLCY